jgi:hypothetical protein
MARNISFQHLRGVFANIPTLNLGELYFATDTNKLYIGTATGNLLVGPSSSSGGIGGQGTGVVDFGAFPGNTDTTLVITGQSGILVTSIVNAWIQSTATTDHSADEHVVDPPNVKAGNIVAGTGFTVYAVDANKLSDPKGKAPRVYGKWTVGWMWN